MSFENSSNTSISNRNDKKNSFNHRFARARVFAFYLIRRTKWMISCRLLITPHTYSYTHTQAKHTKQNIFHQIESKIIDAMKQTSMSFGLQCDFSLRQTHPHRPSPPSQTRQLWQVLNFSLEISLGKKSRPFFCGSSRLSHLNTQTHTYRWTTVDPEHILEETIRNSLVFSWYGIGFGMQAFRGGLSRTSCGPCHMTNASSQWQFLADLFP